ncbi:MAG: hypothetical protein HY689_02170 [Chloroflexi bacterium]|nr:hypothetical protein [Chloroflexota bacterium]
MTFEQAQQARRMAQCAGFPVVGSECLATDDDEIYTVAIRDVEAGRRLTFVHLDRLAAYLTEALAVDAATPHAGMLAGSAA